MQREPDDRLSPRRSDHKTERAHDNPLAAIDERPIARVEAMNNHDRAGRQAA